MNQFPNSLAVLDVESLVHPYTNLAVHQEVGPALIATVFIRLMDALRTVDEVLMLTGGGPGSATRYIGVHIFKEVFPRTNYGYGSAVSLVVLYLTIVICWLLYVSLIAPRSKRG